MLITQGATSAVFSYRAAETIGPPKVACPLDELLDELLDDDDELLDELLEDELLEDELLEDELLEDELDELDLPDDDEELLLELLDDPVGATVAPPQDVNAIIVADKPSNRNFRDTADKLKLGVLVILIIIIFFHHSVNTAASLYADTQLIIFGLKSIRRRPQIRRYSATFCHDCERGGIALVIGDLSEI